MKYALLETNYTVGERVRIVREDLGYTREKFAEILDVSASTLANVELGRTQIPHVMLFNLYEMFGISSDDILHGTKKADTIQKKISRIISGLNKDKSKYVYKIITDYISFNK